MATIDETIARVHRALDNLEAVKADLREAREGCADLRHRATIVRFERNLAATSYHLRHWTGAK